MKRVGLVIALVLVLLLAAALVLLYTCSGGDVAATVKGKTIYEEEITERIEKTRSDSPELADASGWATYLTALELTPETYREQIIRERALALIADIEAERQGIKADTAAVDELIKQVKAGVEGGEAEWLEALGRMGFKSEEAYRDVLLANSRYTQLYDRFPIEPSAEELERYARANASRMEGYVTPPGGVVFSEIPQDILDKLTEQWKQAYKASRFTEWLEKLADEAEIDIKPMPANLSYDVNMSLAVDPNLAQDEVG